MKIIGRIFQGKKLKKKVNSLKLINKSYFFVFLLYLFSCTSYNKSFHNTINCLSVFDSLTNEVVYLSADEMPEFNYDNNDFLIYIMKNFKRNNTYGQLSFSLSFVIDIDGKLKKARINNKNIFEYSASENELIQLLENMPRWEPGRCEGEKVPIKLTFPFDLKPK